MKTGKYDPLLILRGIAILIVLIWHSFGARLVVRLGSYDLFYLLPASGFWGIWIFLCLSGYLMGKVFFIGKYKLNFWGVMKFYYNRIIRIVPLYLPYVFGEGWALRYNYSGRGRVA